MATANIIAEYVRTDTADETMLRIYENKGGFRGTLLNSYGNKLDSITVRGKNAADCIYTIMKRYGFDNCEYYAHLSPTVTNKQ